MRAQRRIIRNRADNLAGTPSCRKLRNALRAGRLQKKLLRLLAQEMVRIG
ncbi:MAG: hypothetical protein QOF80_267 [Verrucomicrobiota bacterium]|jgi:hypothetical protein